MVGQYAVQSAEVARAFVPIVAPLVLSREVKLSPTALRKDARYVRQPLLGEDGANLPAVVSLWRTGFPERAAALKKIVCDVLPEMTEVLALPAPTDPDVRLWFEQIDGERFDAQHVSDGVLAFVALAVVALDARPGATIFIEEPEHSIHALRLHALVDLLRAIVVERGTQFVVATHSPILLNQFRDEPESILLFRRSETGTQVRTLNSVPVLMEALAKSDPGEMLANGFFNDPL